jgi:hypothetical protein
MNHYKVEAEEQTMPKDYQFFDTEIKLKPEVVELCWLGFDKPNDVMTQADFLNQLKDIDDEKKELDISGNQFGRCDNDFLMKMISAITARINLLNLSFNNLHQLNAKDLEDFLKLVPDSVEHLNLSNNKFKNYPYDELLIALIGLPESVMAVDLSYNFAKDSNLLEQLQKGLYSSGKHLQLLDENALTETSNIKINPR